ncbi:MAG: hypothetical protein U0176_10765 [Bacteroidia bacterium]
MNRLLVLVLIGGTFSLTTQLAAQGAVRGTATDDSGFEAAQRSIANQLVVEEMENAGFELDVEEGFDEEWEEDLWVGSEPEDVDPDYVDPSEAERFDVSDVPHAEEIAADWSDEAWEDPEAVLENVDEVVAPAHEEEIESEGALRGEESGVASEDMIESELESDLSDDLGWEEDTETAELNWWEEGNEWEDVIDDMDDFEEDFDAEEDLDLLEEMYERG